MFFIVLDTTEIHQNFALAGPRLQTLEMYCRSSVWRIALPQAVVEEHVNDFRQRLTESKKGFDEVNRLTSLLQNKSAVDFSVEDRVNEYRDYVNRWLGALCHIIPTPSTFTEWTVRNCALNRKPFGSNKGFMDAAIWLTVLQMVKDGHNVAFITSNKKDFADGDQLHPDLMRDVRELGVVEGTLSIEWGLSSIIDEYLRPSLDENADDVERLKNVQEELVGERFKPLNLAGWTEANWDDLDMGAHFVDHEMNIGAEFYDVDYHSLLSVNSVDSVSVRQIRSDLLLIEFNALVTILLSSRVISDRLVERPEQVTEMVSSPDRSGRVSGSRDPKVLVRRNVTAALGLIFNWERQYVYSGEISSVFDSE